MNAFGLEIVTEFESIDEEIDFFWCGNSGSDSETSTIGKWTQIDGCLWRVFLDELYECITDEFGSPLGSYVSYLDERHHRCHEYLKTLQCHSGVRVSR
jgi:hypothetical protein